jgi:uncharacterized protein (TIGR01777 family)
MEQQLMKIYVSGASGLIGSALVADLSAAGHTVQRLVRHRELAVGGDVYWNPAAGELERAAVAEADAIVNLAGESIAAGRWTARQKRAILESRVNATRTIAEALSRPDGRPKILVNASAIGYYGDRGDELLDENSPSGSGDFLSEVCRQWEAAAAPAARGGARVVLARIGVVLSRQGGALAKMLTPFRLGLGGRAGSGRQYMSWIALTDVVGAVTACLVDDKLSGPVNIVAPEPVTNHEFTKTLGRVLRRPTIVPLPAPIARLALGQMADELLLASQRVQPAKLLVAGYAFKFPQLERTLRMTLFPWAEGLA